MELFIEETKNKYLVCQDGTNPADLSQWYGLGYSDDEEVTTVGWGHCPVGDSIHLEWLPATVIDVFLNDGEYDGTVCLTELPEGFQKLSLPRNDFWGTVDLTRLPCGLQELLLDRNGFSGETDFSQLPDSLRTFNVSYTRLTGELERPRGKLFATLKSTVKIKRL